MRLNLSPNLFFFPSFSLLLSSLPIFLSVFSFSFSFLQKIGCSLALLFSTYFLFPLNFFFWGKSVSRNIEFVRFSCFFTSLFFLFIFFDLRISSLSCSLLFIFLLFSCYNLLIGVVSLWKARFTFQNKVFSENCCSLSSNFFFLCLILVILHSICTLRTAHRKNNNFNLKKAEGKITNRRWDVPADLPCK
jgi:hypothetical protein